MKRQKDETISMFNKRFFILFIIICLKKSNPMKLFPCCVMQHLFIHRLAFLLMERRYVTLQQMIFYAQEIEDNLLTCGKLSDQIENDEWNVQEHETIIELEGVDLHPNPFQHEQRTNYAMNFLEGFNDDVFAKDKDQLVKEKVVVPIFLVDDIIGDFDIPIYDEYDDHDDVYFQETLAISFQSENVLIQQSDESIDPIYNSYFINHMESCELVGGNSLSLCFSSFRLLK
jgi:hypothetical protein